jgi:hypothetical protein
MLREEISKLVGWIRPYKYARQGNIAMHQYNAIYIFIPKVACSSIKLAIADLIGVPSPDQNNKLAFPHKRNYPYVKRNEVCDKYESYFRFAFVRNPWDRVLSCYQNKIVGVREGKFGEIKLPVFMERDSNRFSLDMSFEEFVEVLMDIPDLKADGHYRSQHTFLEDDDGKMMANFIGRFESLNEDIKKIKLQIGAPEFHLPHVMKSKRDRIYRKYYTNQTRALVEERYKRDIELFEYSY